MRIGVLGTGQVGGAVGRKLAALGHEVMLGSREPGAKAQTFAGVANLRLGTYVEAAAHGEWIVNALPGEQSTVILGTCAVDGKILVDIANYDIAVDQPIGEPLGQVLQQKFPRARVVKTLNSVSAHLMVDPQSLSPLHHVFIASDDAGAKRQVTDMLHGFGWKEVLDLGDLSACRAMEQLIPLWMRLESALGGPNFNLAVIRA